MKSPAFFVIAGILLGGLIPPVPAAESENGLSIFHDEAGNRCLFLIETHPPQVTIVIRTPGEPGFDYRWTGRGTREKREIIFSRIVGEDEAPGTKFAAKASATRVEVGFQEGQASPADEGINGEYRRFSIEKALSAFKKEFQAAEDSLETALRQWGPANAASAGEWKKRWPELRTRWLAWNHQPIIADPAASAVAPTAPETAQRPALGSKEPDGPVQQPDHWLALIAATGQGLNFVRQPPASRPDPAKEDGDFSDGFGGNASLRARSDGSLRLSLGCQRGPDEGHGADLSLDIPAETVKREEKTGDWSATIAHTDPERPAGEPQAVIHLRRTGDFLWVDTENARRYSGLAWFDGLYRWGPVAVSE